jgi:hypothetical protein
MRGRGILVLSGLAQLPPAIQACTPPSFGMGDGEDTTATTGDRSKRPGGSGYNNVSWHPDLAPQLLLPQKGGPAEGIIPLMEVKVFCEACLLLLLACCLPPQYWAS